MAYGERPDLTVLNLLSMAGQQMAQIDEERAMAQRQVAERCAPFGEALRPERGIEEAAARGEQQAQALRALDGLREILDRFSAPSKARRQRE